MTWSDIDENIQTKTNHSVGGWKLRVEEEVGP